METEVETEINESDIYGAMDTLDLSWLEDEELLLNPANYVVKPLERLRVSLIYLNTENTEVLRENTYLDIVISQSPEHIHSILDKTKLLKWLDTYKRHYSLLDIQLFHFPMTADKVQSFTFSEIDNKFAQKYLKSVSVSGEQTQWILDPTVLLFHDLSELFVFYKELPPPPVASPAPKSILKTNISSGNTTTKKVRISLSPQEDEMKRIPSVNRTSTKLRSTRKIRIL
jgi:hypothetical protein